MRRSRLVTFGLLTLLFSLFSGNLFAAEMLHAKNRASASQVVKFDVYLRTQNQDGLDRLLVAQHTPGNALYRKWITPPEFRARLSLKDCPPTIE